MIYEIYEIYESWSSTNRTLGLLRKTCRISNLIWVNYSDLTATEPWNHG